MVPERYGISPEARWQNVQALTAQYRQWTLKDLRPRGLWDQPV